MRRSLTKNIGAHIVGRVYTAAIGFAFVPIYLHFLGVEKYGLFALLNSYMAAAALLDLGFSFAMTRQVARLSEVAPERMRDLVVTIGLPYCIAALLIAGAIYVLSSWITSVAIAADPGLPRQAVARAVGFAGFALTLQLPIFLFSGGLAGLQRQDLASAVTIFAVTLRHGVALLLLSRGLDSVEVLMASQAVVAGLGGAAAFIVLWAQLPFARDGARFRPALLLEAWGFAASVTTISICGTVVLQSDKAIIGAVLPLREVGVYMLASTVASNLLMLSQPVITVALPRFTQLAAARDWSTSQLTFQSLSQILAWMVLPVAVTIAALPHQALFAWTGNTSLAARASAPLSLLALGAGFSICDVGYALILARGQAARFAILTLVVSVVTVPTVYLATVHFGIVGAAAGMCAFFAGEFVICAIMLVHLVGSQEWSRWILKDVLAPFALMAAIAGLIAEWGPSSPARGDALAELALTWLLGVVAFTLVLPMIRRKALWFWSQLWRRSFRPIH
ncbi:MAG TPA: oligosaccharide flippase family protein [Stellaceae bacterium]|nr:oligosaccharide flippase family protein [Stellaceae bacterium]